MHSFAQFSIDENSIYIIGGWQNGSKSNKTWIIDPTNGFKMKEGPSLIIERYQHSSGKMKARSGYFLGSLFTFEKCTQND